MAKEFLFKSLLPVAGFCSCIYWLFGSNLVVRFGLMIGWFLVVIAIIVGLKQKWFE